jgi:hypothetical protein
MQAFESYWGTNLDRNTSVGSRKIIGITTHQTMDPRVTGVETCPWFKSTTNHYFFR